jgi:hypothetical protein
MCPIEGGLGVRPNSSDPLPPPCHHSPSGGLAGHGQPRLDHDLTLVVLGDLGLGQEGDGVHSLSGVGRRRIQPCGTKNPFSMANLNRRGVLLLAPRLGYAKRQMHMV